MPSLSVQRQPQALMAIDMNSSHDVSFDNFDDIGSETEEQERKGRVRVKSRQRVRSYQQLLEDFQQQSHAIRPRLSSKASQSQIKNVVGMDDTFGIGIDEHEVEGEGEEHDHPFYTPTHSIVSSLALSSKKPQRRVEDTARRSQRFSLPAVGLHTTVVTTRTSIESEEVVPVSSTGRGGSEEGVVVEEGVNNGLSQRFSLALVGRNSRHVDATGSVSGQHDHSGRQDDLGLAKGLTVARLSELLSRKLTTKT